jgi:hypothetical protein
MWGTGCRMGMGNAEQERIRAALLTGSGGAPRPTDHIPGDEGATIG